MLSKRGTEKIEELFLSGKHIKDLFNFFPLPVFLVDPEEKILEANPEFCKITNYNSEETIGKNINVFFEEKKVRKILEETSEKGFAQGKKTNIITKEKEKIPISLSAKLIKDKENRTSGYFVISKKQRKKSKIRGLLF
jgi:PAS domain S-box-containing protein